MADAQVHAVKPDPILLICLHADLTQPSGTQDGGGTHAYLRELAVGLAAKGYECRVVTRRRAPDLAPEVRVSPLTTLYRIDIGDPGPLDKACLDTHHPQTMAALGALWEGLPQPPALIHSVYWNSGRAAMDLSAERGVPFVHTVISNGRGRAARGASPNAPNREEVEQQVFQAAAFIFSISTDERRDLIDLYGIEGRKIVVVGREVNGTFLTPAQDSCGRPRSHWARSENGTDATAADVRLGGPAP